MLHLVIAAALHLYAAAFFGVGWTLIRRRQAHGVGRILFGFTVALLPLANLAVGELGAVLMKASVLQGALLGGGVLLVTLIAQGVMLAVIGGLYERRSISPLVQTGLTLALLTALVAPLSLLAEPHAALVVLIAAALVALGWGCMAGANRLSLRMSVLLLGGGGLWALGVLVVRAHLAAAFQITHYATPIALVGALFILVDHRLRRRRGKPPRLTALGIGLHGMVLLAVALSIAGLASLGYFDLSARLTVLAAAAVAAAVFGRAAWHHGRSAMTYLAVGFGLLAYFFLPAPFLQAMQLVHHWASGALGYQHQPLPIAYYGLTFIPYLLLLAWGGRRLQSERADLSADLVRSLLGIGGLLVVLALTSIEDLRPMLWTWPLYALGSWIVARLFRLERLMYAGHGLLIAFVCAVGVWALQSGYPLPPMMLLAVGALLVAAAAALSSRTPSHAMHAALGALVVAPFAGLLGWPSAATFAMSQGAAALALAMIVPRTRSTVAAVGAGLLALGATVTTCVALKLPLPSCLLVLLGFGVLGSVGASVFRQAPPDSLRSLALGRATLVASLLALLGAFTLGLFIHPAWAPLLAAAGLVWLAVLSRGAALTPVAAAAAAVAGATTAEQLVAGAWPLASSALSCGLLILAAAVPPSWPAALSRARSLAVVSAGVLVVAVLALWGRALPGQPDASWWGLAANSSLLAFTLTAALLQRERRPELAAGLLAVVGLFGALAVSFGLEALFDVPAAIRPWVHGGVLAASSLGWTMIARRVQHERLAAAARWVACVLPLPTLTWVLGVTISSALLGPQLLETAGAQPGSWLDGSLWSVACAGLALLAVHQAAELRQHVLGWHVVLVALFGLVLMASSALFGAANLAIPTALLGLVVGLVAATRAPVLGRSVPMGWPFGLLLVAIAASYLDIHHPALSVAMASLTAVLFATWLQRFPVARHATAGGWSLAFSVTMQVTVIWLASHLSTGRYSATAVVALLGPAALVSALLLRFAGKSLGRGRPARPVLRHGHANLVVASALACLAVVVNGPSAAELVVPLALGTLVSALSLLVAFGRADGRGWMLHGAGVVAPALYLVARTQTGLWAAGPWLDAVALLVSAQAAFWLGRVLSRRELVSSRALLASAVWWPVLSAGIAPALGASGMALVALLVAIHYAVVAQVTRDKGASVPAMIFGNVALFSAWATLGWSYLLAYAIPVGVTLLAMIHVYADELGRAQRKILRRAVVASLYVLAVGDALLAATPLQALVLVPILCVAGIAIGAVTRVRIYLVMGVVFLAADLVLTMVRYGLDSRPLGALFLTLLGLLLVSAMVLFSLDRERILRRYSTVLGELRAWE